MRFTMRSRFSVSLGAFVEVWAVAAGVVGRWSLVVGMGLVLSARVWVRDCGRCDDLSLAHRLSYRAAFNALFKDGTLKNALHEDAGCVNHVGVQFSYLGQMFDLSDGDRRGGGHHGVEVARRLSVNQISPAVPFPGFDEGEIRLQG